jgi:hypothetical protein
MIDRRGLLPAWQSALALLATANRLMSRRDSPHFGP